MFFCGFSYEIRGFPKGEFLAMNNSVLIFRFDLKLLPILKV